MGLFYKRGILFYNMKIIGDVSEEEMVSEFLRAEANSSRFEKKVLKNLRKDKISKKILLKPNIKDRKENQYRKKLLGKLRGFGQNKELFENFPKEIIWKRAIFSKKELEKVKYIDYDYWKVSGERREGLYAGIGPILSKPMISVALALPTAIMTAYGLVFSQSAEGLVATQGMAAAALGINISFALIPGITAVIGFIIWVKFYPLTGDVVKEMKVELKKIHEQKRKDYEKKALKSS